MSGQIPAYRSAANEAWLASLGRVSHIHQQKPPGRPTQRHIARGNVRKLAVRAEVERVFAHQNGWGCARERSASHGPGTTIGLANLAYNFLQLARISHQRGVHGAETRGTDKKVNPLPAMTEPPHAHRVYLDATDV